MKGRTNDDRRMIVCCNDGTGPVVIRLKESPKDMLSIDKFTWQQYIKDAKKTWQEALAMNKEEILEKSRQELKNIDLVEKDAEYQAGRISGTVGAGVCVIISVLARVITGDYLVSPWIIYFSITGTKQLVCYIKLKKKSDLLLSFVFLAISIVLFAVQIFQFMGVGV